MQTMFKLFGLVALASTAATASPTVAVDKDTAAVRSILSKYEAAVERLDPRGTEILFSKNSEIFESGGQEGNYATYLAHHLTPELAEFKSFKFSDYTISVRFEGPVALATETYKFRIETKKGEVAERLGVATSVLKKVAGQWQIMIMHTSARKLTKP